MLRIHYVCDIPPGAAYSKDTKKKLKWPFQIVEAVVHCGSVF